MKDLTLTSEPSDFDFLVGRWTVHHRRLKARLVGCTDWDEFAGRSELRTLIGGRANIEENVLELPAGHYRALTLRSFNQQTRQWAIWWLDGRHPHVLDAPMVGDFKSGVGTFYGDEIIDNRPIRVRFLWSDIATTSCRWQQAFSADGGSNWETNWVMEFMRDVPLPLVEMRSNQ